MNVSAIVPAKVRRVRSETTRINIGCGDHPLSGFWNVDSEVYTQADIVASVPPIPAPDASVDELFAGHFLEHLTRFEADSFIDECRRVLRPGGKLGIVVPDFREIVRRYLDPTASARFEFPRGSWHDTHDLDEMCHLFVFSTVQPSRHQWAYDKDSLTRLLTAGGFIITGEINKWMDPRISVGAWYQFGLDAIKGVGR